MTAPSLRRRLGLAVLVGIAAAWVAAMAVAALVIRHELDEVYDSALRTAAHRLAPLVQASLRSRIPLDIAPTGSTEYVTYMVRAADGRVLLQSPEARPGRFDPTPRIGLHGNRLLRIYGIALADGSILEVADPAHERRAALLSSLAALLVPLVVLLPLSLGLALWLLRRGLRPVLHLRDDIGRRGSGDLSSLAVPGLPAELVPVAEALNGLIERLRRAIAAERHFAANSAHELRTPLAAALAQSQRLLAETAEPGTRERAQRIETALRQLIRIVEKLMQLARAEGGGLVVEQPTDLAPVIAVLADEFRRMEGVGDRLIVDLPPPGTLISRLDADAFAILMRNLVENALRHGPPDDAVRIEAEAAQVRVINGGPVVPPALLASLPARFVRGSTAPGAGLGLAIADAIAAGAGGRLDLVSPAPGRADGFAALVWLPADAQAAAAR